MMLLRERAARAYVFITALLAEPSASRTRPAAPCSRAAPVCLYPTQVLNLADVFNPDTQHRRTAMPWRAVYHLTKLRELKVT